jgi:hypothetical protein
MSTTFVEVKRPLGRPRRRWEDKRMDLGEIGSVGRTAFSWLEIGFDGELL